MTLVRLGALLAVALAAHVLAAAGAAATGEPGLLDRYAPVLVLHPAEQFAPVPVEGFIADSDLLARAPDGSWQPFAGPLALAPRASRLDQRACKAVDGPAALECYASAEAAHGAPAIVYGAVFRSKARIALQYWLFFPANVWSPTVPAGGAWQSHEGDWEAATVLLDAAGRPLTVGLSRHCGGVTRPWAKAPKRGGRPLAYVSLGSHALGFRTGVEPQERRCWPREALSIFDAFRQQLVDHAARGRVVRPGVVRVTATAPAWMRFPGTWGEDQYVAFPNNAPFRFGAGPQGPAFHTLWQRPFATPLGWRRD
ncbi:MAG TPA: hypothetical protein VFR43_10715 [Gaiellaceae bacterium]|nr:hypothetical protein [Gaiellaceae bacterium]